MATEDPSAPKHGRTAWDFATELLTNKLRLFFLCVFIFLLSIFLLAIADTAAEPGSEVSLFGVVKYTKHKNEIIPPPTPAADAAAPDCPIANITELESNLKNCKSSLASAKKISPGIATTVLAAYKNVGECKEAASTAITRTYPGVRFTAQTNSIWIHNDSLTAGFLCANFDRPVLIVAAIEGDVAALREEISSHLPPPAQ